MFLPTKDLVVNESITSDRVTVVQNGARLGEFLIADAIELAQKSGLDLVEIDLSSAPPTCQIVDYGKLKFDRSKRSRRSGSHRRTSSIKEIRLRPSTNVHDVEVKIAAAREFLQLGDRVRVTVRLLGREMAHRDLAVGQCIHIAAEMSPISRIESPARGDGRSVSMLLAPI